MSDINLIIVDLIKAIDDYERLLKFYENFFGFEEMNCQFYEKGGSFAQLEGGLYGTLRHITVFNKHEGENGSDDDDEYDAFLEIASCNGETPEVRAKKLRSEEYYREVMGIESGV